MGVEHSAILSERMGFLVESPTRRALDWLLKRRFIFNAAFALMLRHLPLVES